MGWEGPPTTWHLAHTNPSPRSHRFPFYYEIKMAFVLWLLSPYTKGASLLYRKFVHPSLSRHEKVPLGDIEQKQRSQGSVSERKSCISGLGSRRWPGLISCLSVVLLWDCDRG